MNDTEAAPQRPDRSQPQTELRLTEAGIATLLLRLLGLTYVLWGFIYGLDVIVRLVLASRQVGLFALTPDHWVALVYPAGEVLVGIYLLIGGNWVFTMLLTPITRETDAAGTNLDDDPHAAIDPGSGPV